MHLIKKPAAQGYSGKEKTLTFVSRLASFYDSLYPASRGEVIGGTVSTNSIAGIWRHNMSARELLSRVRDSESYIGDVSTWVGRVTHGSYLELQYHGALTIEDVASINFKSNPPSQSLLRKLRSKGVKVYYHGQPY